jgi:hypothetical protein
MDAAYKRKKRITLWLRRNLAPWLKN